MCSRAITSRSPLFRKRKAATAGLGSSALHRQPRELQPATNALASYQELNVLMRTTSDHVIRPVLCTFPRPATSSLSSAARLLVSHIFFFPIYLAVELPPPPPFFVVSQAKWKRGGRHKEKKEEKIFKRKKKHLTSVHILTAQNLISHRKPSCRPVISSHHGKRKRYGQYEQKEK